MNMAKEIPKASKGNSKDMLEASRLVCRVNSSEVYDSTAWKPQDFGTLSEGFKQRLSTTMRPEVRTKHRSSQEPVQNTNNKEYRVWSEDNLPIPPRRSSVPILKQKVNEESEIERKLGYDDTPRRASDPEHPERQYLIYKRGTTDELPRRFSQESMPREKEKGEDPYYLKSKATYTAHAPMILITHPLQSVQLDSREKTRRSQSVPVLQLTNETKSEKHDAKTWTGSHNAKTWTGASRQELIRLSENEEEDTYDEELQNTTTESTDSNMINTNKDSARLMPFRAIASFTAEFGEDKILNLEEGDDVNVVEKAENGWWFVESANKKGWFPSNYLVPIPRPRQRPCKIDPNFKGTKTEMCGVEPKTLHQSELKPKHPSQEHTRRNGHTKKGRSRATSSPTRRAFRIAKDFQDMNRGEPVEVLMEDNNGNAWVRVPETFVIVASKG